MKLGNQNIPGLVKEVRKQLGLSQEDLAHALGISFATINRWENGKTLPSKLARTHLKMFCDQKEAQGLLIIDQGEK
ncbi:putative transcriptional regulator, XRE family [uncultured Desulfobacterium sp.]|uniref:Putative transcriptional regulator, XRE family n=1 Tax=uncultured Desulfobacterium sp. TaxID=201089 RepID=A0A445N0J9_9BACT|nr:putative transcriptional regulator, XRE family [uncultured Desulfobacterium sp.]